MSAERAQIVARESDFGRVLFDANGQAIYVFEIDGPDHTIRRGTVGRRPAA